MLPLAFDHGDRRGKAVQKFLFRESPMHGNFAAVALRAAQD
jgi:hypothetical protein